MTKYLNKYAFCGIIFVKDIYDNLNQILLYIISNTNTDHMKKTTLILFAIATLALGGCSKYAMVSFNYPLPPQAEMPGNIKTVALANRLLVNKEDKAGKIIESVLSGEIEVSDRKASEECLMGVSERLRGYDKLNTVIASENKLFGSGTRDIPAPLDWEKVSRICQDSHADALLVLEMFDSNSDMFALPKILAPRPQPGDERTFNVKMYWRLYDPSVQKIIDQYECSRQLTFVSDGSTLTVPPKALHGAAFSGGQEYIERFLPGYFIVDRMLYKKGKGIEKHSFEAAYRHVETDDWEGAADAWEEIIRHEDAENTGRAYLNMAVYFEQTGNIDEAIKYACKAYVDYGIKQGRDYETALRRL